MSNQETEEAAYVTREKDVWHQHTNMSIIEEMENEHLVIVITVKDKLNIGSTSELQNKHTIFGKNDGAVVCKEKEECGMKAVRTGTPYYVKSRNTKEVAKKDVLHRHAYMNIIEEMENEHLIIVITVKDKLNIGSTSELQNKHTSSGKVAGGTIYNMLKLEEAPLDEESEEVKNSSKTKTAGVKEFNLLSFGAEAEEGEEESVILNKRFSSKGKSGHDHLTVAKLSSQPAVELPGSPNKERKETVLAIEKVVMKTTVGDIELELWAKETAKAYRNFIQLCMEGYWDDTIFHRIIKGFITQDGDPTGTGEGGKIYGEPFKDDFHTRLRSCRRDLIAVANAGKMTMVSNTSLFLILHQICRINIQSLVELLVNLYINDKPLYPPRLIKPIILNNPFSDIIPRIIVQECEEVKDSSETQTAGVKYKSYMFAEFSPGRVILCYEKFCYRHFNLLSFGEEADEDEEESVILNKKFSGKGKSSHDHSTDLKLSSQPAVEPPGLANKRRKEGRSSDWENDDEVKTQEELEFVKKEKEAMRKRIRNTLRDIKKEPKKVQNYKIDDVEDDKGIKENE
ncbi:Peptidyl-prolyl cis-trans isomerase CWC27 like protein [Eufriesea mexicana]|nr:Peptidyl-prolyl cis-trans isomerase CWC27 like protein [Eufriesea mexicana]